MGPDEPVYFRKVLHWPVTVSPNIRLALAQIAAGQEPTGEQVWPGVMTWDDYQFRLATLKPDRVCVTLQAKFYAGPELMLIPGDWLDRAARLAEGRVQARGSKTWMGVDPAEGGDETAWAVVDRGGLLKLVSRKTPDTNIIPAETIRLMNLYEVKPENVAFDRGGGKTHADRLRAMGYPVRTVAFGGAIVLEPKRGMTQFDTKREVVEERGAYADKRGQLYGDLAELLDPVREEGFAIPAEYAELRRQLEKVPRWTDERGRLFVPPKHAKSGTKEREGVTMMSILGCSPDQADALVLAVHAMRHLHSRNKAGVI